VRAFCDATAGYVLPAGAPTHETAEEGKIKLKGPGARSQARQVDVVHSCSEEVAIQDLFKTESSLCTLTTVNLLTET
jgi:hypothetical protein